MIRTHITPQTTNISLSLIIPTNYVGKRIEVSLYADDEINEFVQELPKTKLSDKYRNVFSKEDAKNFSEHTQQMRKEWDGI
ncbi:MAG: hypothetical protein ABL940_02840 [Bacteroidia bacterium]